ncbi:MAG: hypothetical protein HKO92_07060 [Flavobacteriaceae bacterium]|nr:hypothetical protein [Flavobacteriaceae bacterium]
MNWFDDIRKMHDHFKVHSTIKNMDNSTLRRLLDFRLSMIREELDETDEAFINSDPEEVVDGIIDLLVFAIGTLEIFGVDAEKAWNEVYKANIVKTPGVKESRPNPFGFPDLIKPEGWRAPSHKGNHGILNEVLKGEK